jgi:heme oxygenase
MIDRNHQNVTLAEWLKKETAQSHAELEKLMQPRHLLDPEVKRDFFINHHRILYRAHVSVIDRLGHFKHDDFVSKYIKEEQELLDALAHDLATLESESQKHEEYSFRLTSSAQAYGALYVALGSNMGRFYMSRQLSEAVKERHLKDPLYYSTLADPLPAWLSFKEELNAMREGAGFRAEVLKGAHAAFAIFMAVARDS